MIYLSDFYFPTPLQDELFINDIKLNVYNTYYPFGLLPGKGLRELSFRDITILYGGNGSGKSTVLNIIASKIDADRMAPYNKTNFYQDYLDLCDYDYANGMMENKKIITSDDVFDYMLDIRSLNENIDVVKEERLLEHQELKYSKFKFDSMEDIEQVRARSKAKRLTQSKFTRDSVTDNVREYSNGESAYRYFLENIKENGLYILDEPENSLSPKMQLELMEFILKSVRFFRCQFIISTHSPFLLSMDRALIYNLDKAPVETAKWHELENVRTYYDFFKKHEKELEDAGQDRKSNQKD